MQLEIKIVDEHFDIVTVESEEHILSPLFTNETFDI